VKEKLIKNNGRDDAGIFNAYSRWIDSSIDLNYSEMLNDVKPNSDFHEITLNCLHLAELGIKCRYEMEDLEVVHVDKSEDTAVVTGKLRLIHNDYKLHNAGRFISTCHKHVINGSPPAWQLDGIDIEWEI